MRKFVLIACMALFSLALGAQGIPVCKEVPFQDGEKIEMVLMYKWGLVNTEVGSVYTTLEQDADVFRASCLLRTAPFFDAFYKMRENFQGVFTVDGHRPLEATRDTYQNGYTANNHFRFDWDAGVVHAQTSYNGKDPDYNDFSLEGLPRDVVTLIFHFRNMDFSHSKAGDQAFVPCIVDDELITLRVTCQGKDDIKVRRQGRFHANRFSCTVVSGHIFEGDQEVQVWVSDDDNHLPLAIMLPLRMGTMWVWLRKTENLKNEITSRYQ